jgi:hypothetical protein
MAEPARVAPEDVSVGEILVRRLPLGRVELSATRAGGGETHFTMEQDAFARFIGQGVGVLAECGAALRLRDPV